MNDETQLSERLKAVAEAVAEGHSEVEAARLALKKRESEIASALAQSLSEIAETVVASGSQALRQRVIRSLYWDAWVKAKLISGAFGITSHAAHRIAGPLVELIPCSGGCGVQVERVYRSHSDHHEVYRPRGAKSIYSVVFCQQCSVKREAMSRANYDEYMARVRAEGAARCAQYGHHWGGEEVGGVSTQNGVDWVSSSDNASVITLRMFCMNWCGATMAKTVSEREDTPVREN